MRGNGVAGRSRRPVALLAVALLGLLAAWVVAPHAVPLYDGVGFPDEPYRYVQRPASVTAGTPAPTTARSRISFLEKVNPEGVYLTSGEQGPQISLYLPPRSLPAPATATNGEVTATPLPPDPPVGGDPVVVGNVYRVAVTADGAPLRLDGVTLATIDLRAPQGAPPPLTVVYRSDPGQPWTEVGTTRTGNDIYEAAMRQLGDYALRRSSARSGGSGSSGLVVVLAVTGGLVLLLLVGLRVVLGRRRTRGA